MYNISVIGGGDIDESTCKIAYRVGELLAKNGVTIVCGGLTGVMECGSRGASDAGGMAIGILPGSRVEEGNRYLSARLPTGIGYARDFLVVRMGEAVIAIDGASGTHTEAYFALSERKSLICMGDLSVRREKETDGKLFRVTTPEEAVDIALKEAKIYRESSG